MFSARTYTDRRNKLKESVGNGLILLPGNDDVGMNYKDNVYHFRQDSTFLYYTGIDLPRLFFVIDIDNNTEILFADNPTIDDIVWTGAKEPLASIAGNAGINNLQPFGAISSFLKNALQ
ncbi:MAG: aminopeptidase P N-terminal domain-containing protein, partial [Bacteroidota bacterium]